ncbi:Chromo domain-containing protein [Balamuthia mandrillaris]
MSQSVAVDIILLMNSEPLSNYKKVAKYSTSIEKHFNANNKIIHFSPGDKVMLKNSSANSKTDLKFLSPFIIHHCTDNRAYVLRDITGDILPDKCSQACGSDTPFEDEHFKVEKVLDHDSPPSDCYYLMKLKGYPDSDNSWVAAKDFSSQQPITTYWGKKYPKKHKKHRKQH